MEITTKFTGVLSAPITAEGAVYLARVMGFLSVWVQQIILSEAQKRERGI